MPKVYENKYAKKVAWFRKWFRGKRAMEGVSLSDLAQKRNMTTANVSAKLRFVGSGQTVITYEDLIVFFESVHATPEEIAKCFIL